MGARLIVVPDAHGMMSARMALSQLREVDVLSLLHRPEITGSTEEAREYLVGKRVLVTGAGGSIGSELARQIAKLGPSKLLLLDRDETLLHSLQLSIYGNGLLDTDDIVLCDIRDLDALDAIFAAQRPDVVFHAAALKHLPMLQQYPDEGWKTNVLGTLNVLRCAEKYDVQRLVNVSTDKAAAPINVLGFTKRYAEQLTSHFAQRLNRPWVSVRFGNVLGSRGSVIHSIRRQIELGGPVTITHPDVTRFFMTIPEACQLVLAAGSIGHPTETMVLDMGEPVSIMELAHQIIDESGLPVQIEITGLRPGEKLHEELFDEDEAARATDHPLITRVCVPPVSPDEILANPYHLNLVRSHERHRHV